MELLSRIEIYSAMPYEGDKETSSVDDWFHVARNEKQQHIEAIWDLESMFRPEIPDKPTELMGLEEYFDEIRFHYALNYTSQRYHEDLMLWAMQSLKRGGKLQIVSPDADWILRYWVADAMQLDARKFEKRNPDEKDAQKKQPRKFRGPLSFLTKKAHAEEVRAMLNADGIPEEQLSPKSHDEMADEIPDRVSKDIPQEWDFDVWLMQQLYSSGAGEPQDSFKSMFGKRYLSELLRRSGFVVHLLQNNPQNLRQIEAKAIRHPSRLIGGAR